MSKQTEQTMLDAIRAHFADEGVATQHIYGVKVRTIVHGGNNEIHGAVYHLAPDYFTRVALDVKSPHGVHEDMIVRNYAS